MKKLLVFALLLVAACRGDETLHAYGAGDHSWAWETLNGAPAPGRAQLRFPKPGDITGEAACNRFSARQTAPYPWFEVKEMTVTRATCPKQAAEQIFLTQLSAMTLAEVATDTLILSNDTGDEMVFRRLPAVATDP